MTMHETHFSSEAAPSSKAAAWLFNSIKLAGLRIVTWATTCADYYEAAVMYEKMSSLSDAELGRRGLNRATLARDVCNACDRTNTR